MEEENSSEEESQTKSFRQRTSGLKESKCVGEEQGSTVSTAASRSPRNSLECQDNVIRVRTPGAAQRRKGETKVLMSGWATKESGETFLGKHNWRRRWFVLSLLGKNLTLSYSEKVDSEEPKGVIYLSPDYSAREIETDVKSKPHCFAVGPALDKSALRTYYISCDTEEERIEWIVLINSALEGVPEKALHRKSTYRVKGRIKPYLTRVASDPVRLADESNSFLLHTWRMAQWNDVCDIAKTTKWKRQETKEGVLICRQSFQHTDTVVIKVEGIIDAPVDVTLEYMQRSIKPGGKLDFAFRKEEVVQVLEENSCTVYISRNVYNVPLPGMKKRDVCLLRTWIPRCVTKEKRCGLFVTSVAHPQVPKDKEFERVAVFPSGIVLEEFTGSAEALKTRVIAVFQLDLKDALQNMLRGSYKSGVFRTGLRNFFHHLRENVQSYYDLVRE